MKWVGPVQGVCPGELPKGRDLTVSGIPALSLPWAVLGPQDFVYNMIYLLFILMYF